MPLRLFGLVIVGGLLLYALFTVGFPFLLALIIAILIDPMIRLLMKPTSWNRMVCSTLACTIFILGILGFFYLIGLKIFTELHEFVQRTPDWVNPMGDYMRQALAGDGTFFEVFPDQWRDSIRQGLQLAGDGIASGLNTLISVVSGIFLNMAKLIPNMLIFFIVFFIALYLFSYSLEALKKSFLSLFAVESRSQMEKVLMKLREAIVGFLRAQILISVLTYLVTFVGLMIIGVKYPLAIALIIMFVDLLPVLGTGSVIVPWAIYNMIAGDPRTAIGLLILFIGITVFRRIIEPKIVGDAVGIGALSTLVSLYVGYELVGVIGLFLGPVVVIIYTAMKDAEIIQINIKL